MVTQQLQELQREGEAEEERAEHYAGVYVYMYRGGVGRAVCRYAHGLAHICAPDSYLTPAHLPQLSDTHPSDTAIRRLPI